MIEEEANSLGKNWESGSKEEGTCLTLKQN
jgi:hypothetical protein